MFRESVKLTRYGLDNFCTYRVFTQNEKFAAYTGTDFSHKILQFVCAVCMAQHSCNLHLYVQFVWDACRLQYGCAIQIAHTNPELHKSCKYELVKGFSRDAKFRNMHSMN